MDHQHDHQEFIEASPVRAITPHPASNSASSSPSRSTPATDNSADSPLQSDLFDDIFSAAHAESPLHELSLNHIAVGSDQFQTQETFQSREHSDIPRLRGIHTTAGYRDGIASARDAAVQPGFDEGYVLGAALGIRSGYLLGLMEGIQRALHEQDQHYKRVDQLLAQIKEETAVTELMNKKYLNPDGTWRWDVDQETLDGVQDEDTTINHVADSHPVIRKWVKILGDLMGEAGVRRG